MAAIIVLAVQALVAVPTLIALVTGKGARLAGLLYILVAGGALAASLTLAPGLPSPAAIASASGSEAAGAPAGAVLAAPGGEACEQLVEAMKSSGVILDMSEPPKVVVSGANWSRIPEQYRGPVTACLKQTVPAGAGELQIVNR